MEIRLIERQQLKEKPDQKNLGFGKYMTDYMFVMDWNKIRVGMMPELSLMSPSLWILPA